MLRKRRPTPSPMPPELLEWQVALRLKTMLERDGAPHVGVAPLVIVPRPGLATGVAAHSVICGLLPHRRTLEQKTKEFRQLYESHVGDGARTVYDHGIAYLEGYYRNVEDFDSCSITTLLHEELPLVDALRATRTCSLLFYVFNLIDKSEEERLRCVQMDCTVDLLTEGPIYENVWFHNTLFHGPADDHVVAHFQHLSSWDSVFGGFEEMRS